MNKNIVLFSNYLRNEGVFVSIRSTMLANDVIETFADKISFDEFYNFLKAIYIKDISDTEKFDRVFNRLFKEHEKIEEETNITHEFDDYVELDEFDNEEPFELKQDFNELQQAYDEILNSRSDTKAQDGKLLNSSLMLLDNYDRRVFDLCRKLSRKIANKRSKRYKKNNSHKLDMAKTIRYNIKNGGHIVKLHYQKPHLKKSRHVFLCDVSGSCEWITSLFFAILYGCSQTFDKVEMYDFDNKLTNVTDILDVESFSNLGQINIYQRSKGITCFGQSDMVESFREFIDTATLNSRTDVIILTDCRDWKGKRVNGVLESASLLSQIVAKVNRVIILNPEKRIRWNNQTSCVRDYEKVGVEVYETSSLSQFEKVISKL